MSIKFAMQDRLRRKFNSNLRLTLLSLIHPKPLDKLLDVGGGTGVLAELLSGSYNECWVLEPDRKKVNYAIKKRENVKFVSGTAEHIPFPDGYFNTVLAIGSFHHLYDQDLALEDIRRVTAQGGKLAMLEFDPDTSIGRLANLFENFRSSTRRQFHQPSQLKEKVEQHGLGEVSTTPFTRGYILTATKKSMLNY